MENADRNGHHIVVLNIEPISGTFAWLYLIAHVQGVRLNHTIFVREERRALA